MVVALALAFYFFGKWLWKCIWGRSSNEKVWRSQRLTIKSSWLFCYTLKNYMSGNKIDLPTGSVNYIFSNQELEHLSDDDLVSFLSEEQRIKSDISIIRHSFPSKNTFFETHTKTILLHWLFNRSIFNRLFGRKKREWLENNLFLRWDHLYEKAFAKHLGPFVQKH